MSSDSNEKKQLASEETQADMDRSITNVDSEQGSGVSADTEKNDKPTRAPLSEEEKAVRMKAAAERKAAREKATQEKAAQESATSEVSSGSAKSETPQATERPARTPRAAKTDEAEQPKEPSPLQPRLDRVVEQLRMKVAEDAIEESAINEINGHMPTITVNAVHWLAVAQWLKQDTEWSCNYLRNVSGVDQESYLEVVYHLIGLSTKMEIAVHVKAERDHPSIPSVTPLWPTANWNEREVFDLLGIDFPGHPDLRRIMMPDDWVGYPLRKDYEPLDSEV